MYMLCMEPHLKTDRLCIQQHCFDGCLICGLSSIVAFFFFQYRSSPLCYHFTFFFFRFVCAGLCLKNVHLLSICIIHAMCTPAWLVRFPSFFIPWLWQCFVPLRSSALHVLSHVTCIAAVDIPAIMSLFTHKWKRRNSETFLDEGMWYSVKRCVALIHSWFNPLRRSCKCLLITQADLIVSRMNFYK